MLLCVIANIYVCFLCDIMISSNMKVNLKGKKYKLAKNQQN